LQKKTSNKAL